MGDLQALVASPWWRWIPGMLTLTGLRVDGVGSLGRPVRYSSQWSEWEMRTVRVEVYASGINEPPELPDPTDPATVGCLLALAREAWAEPLLHLVPTLDGGWRVVGFRRERDDSVGAHGPAEPDAIISAILAVPPGRSAP